LNGFDLKFAGQDTVKFGQPYAGCGIATKDCGQITIDSLHAGAKFLLRDTYSMHEREDKDYVTASNILRHSVHCSSRFACC
jgi:hypothetical protein